VYTKKGNRQVVVLGESNENFVVIEQGLEPGVPIYLNTPADPQSFKLLGSDLVKINIDRTKIKKEEDNRKMQEAERAKSQRGAGGGGGGFGGGRNITPEMMQQFQNMRGQGGAGGQRGGQGGQNRVRDTVAMRMRQQGGQPGAQPGAVRDTTVRRRAVRQPAQQ